MPITTGDTFVPKNEERYVIDVSGAEGNPIRGIYHASNPWTEINSVDTYLENGSVSHPHMRQNSIVSVPHTNQASSKRTLYQSLLNAPASPDYTGDVTLGGVVISDMSYNWQQRKFFHEFCMQYDKYGPIDQNHYAENPDLYDFCVWRYDTREFQTIKLSGILAEIIQDGMTEVVNAGFLSVNDIDPSQSNSYFTDQTGDFNGDGSVSTADLLEFLTEFGQVVQNSTFDSSQESYCIVKSPTEGEYLKEFNVLNYSGESYDYADGTMVNFPSLIPGHPSTVPDSAFIKWPEDRALYTNEPEAFLFGVGQVNFFSDPSPSVLDYLELNQIQAFGDDSNFNKVVEVRVLCDVEVQLEDKLYLALKGSYLRNSNQLNARSNTKGKPDGNDFFTTVKGIYQNGDISNLCDATTNPVLQPGLNEDVELQMYFGNPEYTDGNVGWNYPRFAPPGGGAIDSNRLLRIYGGSNNTQQIRVSVGFFSERGHIDQVKIKQIKYSMKSFAS